MQEPIWAMTFLSVIIPGVPAPHAYPPINWPSAPERNTNDSHCLQQDLVSGFARESAGVIAPIVNDGWFMRGIAEHGINNPQPRDAGEISEKTYWNVNYLSDAIAVIRERVVAYLENRIINLRNAETR